MLQSFITYSKDLLDISIINYLQIKQMQILTHFSVLQILLVLLLVFVIHHLYTYGLAPYLKLIRKRRQLQGKYQVYQYPFTPYGFSFMIRFALDFKQHGDSMHFRKHVLPKKDVSIGTVKDKLLITLVNEKLINQFSQRNKQGCYVKTNGGIHLPSLFQFLGTGLLLSEGEQWRYKRKIMSSLFNFQFIKEKINMISSISKDMFQEVKIQKNQKGQVEINVIKVFQKIFGSVVVRCFFGDTKLEPIKNKNVFEFLSELSEKIAVRNLMVSSFIFGSFLRKWGIRKIDRQINQQIQIFRQYVKHTINQIIEQVENGTIADSQEGLVAKLMRSKQLVKDCSLQQKIEKGYYTYQDLVNQMCTFFLAGTDTTSGLVTTLIYKFTQHPEIQQKVRQEIKDILNNDINNINMENIKKMVYLKNVQSQILRIMTPLPFILPRVALKDHKIGQIAIQKGTLLILELMSNQYNQDTYSKPFQFLPERWQKLQKYEGTSRNYYPFSLGGRSCIGQQLALIQSKVALIIFLLYFNNGKQLSPLKNKFNLSYAPQKSIMHFSCL